MINDVETHNITKVFFKNDARRRLYRGIECTAESVACTLGPKGKTVVIQKKDGPPVVTKDGVTVSKSVRPKDPVERMGADLIREAASQTNEVAGDGTTTATVLTYALVKGGLKYLEAGFEAKELCEGMERARALVDEFLVKSAKKLTTKAEIAQVGTISANGDGRIGNLIADAMEKVGSDGIITVEDAKGMETTLETVEGMQFERGYLSPYFVTNQERMNVTYNDARVLVTDKKLSSLSELIPLLEKVVRSQSKLLIIAEDVDGEAMQGLVVNRVNANLAVVAVKAPGYGKHKDELLHDIAVLTGTTVVSPAAGLKIEKLELSDLGTVKKVVVDAKSTTLVGAGASRPAVDAHVANLRTQLEDVTLSTDEVTKLKVRIARLASGVAVIKVGGSTELEMIEKKYRIEDALNATRAAVAEGIVVGGGTAFFDATLNVVVPQDDVGAKLVMTSILAPLQTIVSNAGKSHEVVINNLRNGMYMSDFQFRGYDAANDREVDMFAHGIIDPVKVSRTALKNAVSVAITFLSIGAVIVEDTKDSEKDDQ